MTPPLSPMTTISPMATMSTMPMLPNPLQSARPANLYTDCYTYPPYADSYMSSAKARPSPYGYPVDYGTYSPRMKGIYTPPRTNNFAYGYDTRWYMILPADRTCIFSPWFLSIQYKPLMTPFPCPSIHWLSNSYKLNIHGRFIFSWERVTRSTLAFIQSFMDNHQSDLLIEPFHGWRHDAKYLISTVLC